MHEGHTIFFKRVSVLILISVSYGALPQATESRVSSAGLPSRGWVSRPQSVRPGFTGCCGRPATPSTAKLVAVAVFQGLVREGLGGRGRGRGSTGTGTQRRTTAVSSRSVRLHWAVVELTMYVLVVLKDSGSSTALDDEHEGGSAQF